MDNSTQESLLPLNKASYSYEEYEIIVTQLYLKIKELIDTVSVPQNNGVLWYTERSLLMKNFVFECNDQYEFSEKIHLLLTSNLPISDLILKISASYRIPLLLRSTFLCSEMSYSVVCQNGISNTFSYREVVSLIISGMTDKWNKYGGLWLLQSQLTDLNVELKEYWDVNCKDNLYDLWMKKLQNS